MGLLAAETVTMHRSARPSGRRPPEQHASGGHGDGGARGGTSQRRTTATPRRLAWRCYGLQAAGLFLYIIPIWLQVYIDTRRASQVSVDAFSESHRHWRVRTTLLFLIWTILGGFTLPFGIGWLILVPAFAWYAWRIVHGTLRFARGLPMGRPAPAASG